MYVLCMALLLIKLLSLRSVVDSFNKITLLTFLARKSKMVEVFWGFYCLRISEKRAKSTTHLCGIYLSDRPHFLLVYRRNLQTIRVRGLCLNLRCIRII